jgi:hypothetical protein
MHTVRTLQKDTLIYRNIVGIRFSELTKDQVHLEARMWFRETMAPCRAWRQLVYWPTTESYGTTGTRRIVRVASSRADSEAAQMNAC